MNKAKWHEDKLSKLQKNTARAWTKPSSSLSYLWTLPVTWANKPLLLINPVSFFFLYATRSILMMQYPASLLVLTANTLYKPSGVFLFCFLKNKQAKPPTFLRRRQNLIQPLRNLPIPGPRRKIRQGFEARIWLYKTSQQAYCGFAATFCLHIHSPHRNVPAWAPISSSSPCVHQTKLSYMSHLMYFLAYK